METLSDLSLRPTSIGFTGSWLGDEYALARLRDRAIAYLAKAPKKPLTQVGSPTRRSYLPG